MTPSPVECLLTLTRLTASFKDGKPPSKIKGSLSSSSEKDVCCCAQSSQHRENRESSLSSHLRRVQDRVRTIISDLRKKKRQAKLYKPSEIDSTLAGDQVKLRRVSELTGSARPISLKIPNMSSFSAAQKLDYDLYEMSPDSQLPVEIYSPEPSSTSDNGDGWSQLDRKEVSNYDFQTFNAVMSPGTPVAEMPGDCFHFVAPDADAGHVTHTEWPLDTLSLLMSATTPNTIRRLLPIPMYRFRMLILDSCRLRSLLTSLHPTHRKPRQRPKVRCHTTMASHLTHHKAKERISFNVSSILLLLIQLQMS